MKRTVVFDGDCGFCARSVRIGRALDWLGLVDWRARLEPGLKERFPAVSDKDSQNRMLSVLPDGRVLGGFYAVRDIWLRLPLLFLPGLILYIPGMHILGEPAYRWIARNRHFFGGRKECSL